MASRRGNGEGSIFQRADGRWVATVEIGMQPNAAGVPVRRRRTLYGKTRREAQHKLRETQAKVDAGETLTADKQTVATYRSPSPR